MDNDKKQEEFLTILENLTINIDYYDNNYLVEMVKPYPYGCYVNSKWSFDYYSHAIKIEHEWEYRDGEHIRDNAYYFPIHFFLKDPDDFMSFTNNAKKASLERIERMKDLDNQISAIRAEAKTTEALNDSDLIWLAEFQELKNVTQKISLLKELFSVYSEEPTVSMARNLELIRNMFLFDISKLSVRQQELEEVLEAFKGAIKERLTRLNALIATLTAERSSLSTGSRPIDGWDVHWIK